MSATMLDTFRRLLRFDRWATERVLGAAASLDAERYARNLGGSFPSVRATLEHMLLAEGVWLSRFQGNPLGEPPDVAGCDDAAAPRRRWERHWTALDRFVAGLTDADLARTVHLRTRSGLEMDQPLGELLLHVVHHGTYHRGQVTNHLRQLGAEPVATDYLLFANEHPR